MITYDKAKQYLRDKTPVYVRHGAYDLKGAVITGVRSGGMGNDVSCRVRLGSMELKDVPLSHIFPIPVQVT